MATVANDGQTLAGQTASVQTLFNNTYGAAAASTWVDQHNTQIGGQATTGLATAASDRQTLASQPASVQAMFNGTYGPESAPSIWAAEHNADLAKQAGASTGGGTTAAAPTGGGTAGAGTPTSPLKGISKNTLYLIGGGLVLYILLSGKRR